MYDITQKFDVLSATFKEDIEKFKENFTVLIAKVANVIASVEYQETIATILACVIGWCQNTLTPQLRQPQLNHYSV